MGVCQEVVWGINSKTQTFQEVTTAILKEKADIGSEEDPKQAYESIAFVEQLQAQIMLETYLRIPKPGLNSN